MNEKKDAFNSSTPDDRVLQYLRKTDEIQLHTEIYLPLLKKIGTHVQYVHGAPEEGKDFVYLVKDVYGDQRLEVCQIKNKPFSGSATSPMNVTSVLTQVIQCAELEVTNPITHHNELPDYVTLFSTYDLPQKDTRSAGTLLGKFQKSRCKFVGPEKLIGLIKMHLQATYDSLAHVSDGLEKALYIYADKHHEAGAFGLHTQKSLHTFFVDLGIAGRFNDAINDGSIKNEHISKYYYEDLHSFQLSLPPDLQKPDFLIVNKIKRGKDYSYEILGNNFSILNSNFEKHISNAKLTKHDALRCLTSWSEFLNHILSKAPLDTNVVRTILSSSKTFEVPGLPPNALINFNENICITGEAGAGKTSLARAITRAALEAGKKCVYFPCHYYRVNSATIMSATGNFLSSLSPDVSVATTEEYLNNADIIILDGCDEAHNLGKGFEKDLAVFHSMLYLKRDINVVIEEASSSIRIPEDIKEAIRVTDITQQRGKGQQCRLTCVLPLKDTDFCRLVNLNPHISKAIEELQIEYLKKAYVLILTTRDEKILNLPSGYHHVSLNPFNDNQLKTFFSRWFSDDSKALQEIFNFFDHHKHVKDVCRQPIVASLLAAMYQNGYNLPHTKTDLYAQRFDLLLQDWDRTKNVPRDNVVRTRDKLEFLTHLAYKLHKEHRREFTLDDIIALWDGPISDLYPNVSTNALITELHILNGVIEKTASDTFTLGHLSYQEYLTARAILQLQKERDLFQHYHERWWREVLIFYAGLRSDISNILENMLNYYGLDKNAGLLTAMMAEARFTSRLAADAVQKIMKDNKLILDSEGEEFWEP